MGGPPNWEDKVGEPRQIAGIVLLTSNQKMNNHFRLKLHGIGCTNVTFDSNYVSESHHGSKASSTVSRICIVFRPWFVVASRR